MHPHTDTGTYTHMYTDIHMHVHTHRHTDTYIHTGTDTDTSDQYLELLVYTKELVQYTLIEHSERTKIYTVIRSLFTR